MAEILLKDGKKVAIIRPENPALALEMVKAIREGTPHKKAQRAFNRMLDAQPYKFMGYAAKGEPHFLNEFGQVMGNVEPGDSFVDFDAITRKEQRA
jgi:hypothetical protein